MYYCRCNSKNFMYLYLEKTKMLKLLLHIICENATFTVSEHCMIKIDSKSMNPKWPKIIKDYWSNKQFWDHSRSKFLQLCKK